MGWKSYYVLCDRGGGAGSDASARGCLQGNRDALDDVRAGFGEEGEELLVRRLRLKADGRSSRARGAALRAAPPLRKGLVRPQRTSKEESTPFSPLPRYRAPGGLQQVTGRDA